MLDLKNFATWEEANKWLAKHGFGMTQIAQIKEEWDAAVKPATPTKIAEVSKPTTSTTSKTTVTTKPTAESAETKK